MLKNPGGIIASIRYSLLGLTSDSFEPLKFRRVFIGMIKPLPSNIRQEAVCLVHRLLDEDSFNEISETSVHRPRRSQIWQDYLSGALDEQDSGLTQLEIEALFGLAHNPEEYPLIAKVLRLTQ